MKSLKRRPGGVCPPGLQYYETPQKSKHPRLGHALWIISLVALPIGWLLGYSVSLTYSWLGLGAAWFFGFVLDLVRQEWEYAEVPPEEVLRIGKTEAVEAIVSAETGSDVADELQ